MSTTIIYMNIEQIDHAVEFWKDQLKAIKWSDEYTTDKKALIEYQSTRQILCSRLGQTCLNKDQRKAIIESFKGEARIHVQDIIERYVLKD